MEAKTSLDDLVALLLQGQAPFGDAEFIEAAQAYRRQMPGGSLARTQVNLAACLYLHVRGERITEPRVRDLGGWGQRNAMLADIASFQRGHRPSTRVSIGKSMLQLGAPAADVLHIAVSQGLEAAQKAMEADLQARFDLRAAEIQAVADQRVQAAERNALAATELKEAAQAQVKLLEQKFDQMVLERADLLGKAEASESRAKDLAVQVESLTASLQEAQARVRRQDEEIGQLRAQIADFVQKREHERKEHLLALDRARHGSDQVIASQQAEIKRLVILTERLQQEVSDWQSEARKARDEITRTRKALAESEAKNSELQHLMDQMMAKVDALLAEQDECAALHRDLFANVHALRSEMGSALTNVLSVINVLREEKKRPPKTDNGHTK